MPEGKVGQHGRGGRGDERWEHGPPEGGPGTGLAAGEAGTLGYGNAGRCGGRGRAARRRPVVPASASARHQMGGATVEKSGSVSGSGAKEAYNDTRWERQRVQHRMERRGSHLSSLNLPKCIAEEGRGGEAKAQHKTHTEHHSKLRVCFTSVLYIPLFGTLVP